MNEYKKENFDMKDAKDICHYSCSKLNMTNLLLVVVIILLVSMLFK
jgi:hypothetical protein